MAVVNYIGLQAVTAMNNTGAGSSIADASLAGGRVRYYHDRVAVANGDSINSTILFAKIPSNAVILPQSIIEHDGITSLSDFDIGVYRNGVVVDADCLADGLTLASAGTKVVIASVAIENRYKKLWQLAGYTSDPGGLLEIVGTLKAAAGAAGDITINLLTSGG